MDQPRINRRRFLKYASAVGLSCALGEMVPFGAQSQTRPDSGVTIPSNVSIIDPHAHPGQFYANRSRRIDDSSTLEKIKAVGMVASAFAVVGDLEYTRRSFDSSYQSTVSQLSKAYDLVQAGKVKPVLKTSDIPAVVNREIAPGAILAIEGGDPLEGKPDRVNEFYREGVRIITIVHYRNNELGDIMAPYENMDPGPYRNGLSQAGRKIVERMQELGMVVDVAHAHTNTLKDIAGLAGRPLLDSHTSPCPREDAQSCRRLRTWHDMELIAKTGGVICTWPFGFERPYYKRRTFSDWAQEIVMMKKKLGIDHIGLGTDGGGNIPVFIEGYSDVRDLPKLAAAMEEAGLSPEEIRQFMGGNVRRVLQACLG